MIEEQLDKVYLRDGEPRSQDEGVSGVYPLYGEMTRRGADKILKQFRREFGDRKGGF